jgi:hypothetical protein
METTLPRLLMVREKCQIYIESSGGGKGDIIASEIIVSLGFKL